MKNDTERPQRPCIESTLYIEYENDILVKYDHFSSYTTCGPLKRVYEGIMVTLLRFHTEIWYGI